MQSARCITVSGWQGCKAHFVSRSWGDRDANRTTYHDWPVVVMQSALRITMAGRPGFEAHDASQSRVAVMQSALRITRAVRLGFEAHYVSRSWGDRDAKRTTHHDWPGGRDAKRTTYHDRGRL